MTNGDSNPVGSVPPKLIQSPNSEPQKQVAIPGFSSMSLDLQFTLVNLVQAWPTVDNSVELGYVCRWLAIVQDRTASKIHAHVVKLLKRKLVTISTEGEESCELEMSDLRLHKKFIKRVTSRHPDYDIHFRKRSNSIRSLESFSRPQRIRVLTLHNCKELERVDVGKLPMLRSLFIKGCSKLKKVSGWENLSELGWLDIGSCDSYHEYPKVHLLPSLREVSLDRRFELGHPTVAKPDFIKCVRLHRLWIARDLQLKESWDVSTLKCLKDLKFSKCESLESIVGLSKVLGLTTLSLWGCGALKRVPDLGQLRELTELDLCKSGVEEIAGVEYLHSLTRLNLGQCIALRRLPYLGHLRALLDLDISGTGVVEIPGVGELVSLKRLNCEGSKLQWLPDLGHLLWLELVTLRGAPLVESCIYFSKEEVRFSEKGKRADEVDDMGDSDYFHSDDEEYNIFLDVYSETSSSAGGFV